MSTLRFYSDIGVVPPARRTAAGYRMYGEEERLRLETVKTLRSLGFGLDEIAGTLEARRDLRDTIAVQLRAVESRRRELERITVVLRAALRRSDEPTSAHLARLETLARLSASERTRLPDDFLDDVRREGPADDAWTQWWSGFREASLPDLPDRPTPEQLDAWLELAELLADADFRDRIRDMVATADESPRQRPMDLHRLFDDALAAADAGVMPDDAAADPLVARFIAAHEPAVGAGPDLPRRALAHIDRHDDPRARRYWELVDRIRGRTGEWPQARASRWLITALRHRVTATGAA